jgi:hypothetical protein
MADRVKNEADAKESVYLAEVELWEAECNEIEAENERVRQHNQNRENLIAEVTKQFESDTATYERELREYQVKMEQRQAAIDAAVPDETGYVPQPPPEPLAPERPMPLDTRLEPIKRDHPVKQESPKPPKPEPEPSLRFYVELRDLLYDKLSTMKERETTMEETFARRILRLQAEGMQAVDNISINLGDDFLEYLMESRIRGLGRLLPRISRVYLRDPKDSDLLYMATYEYYADSLSVSIGSTTLR